MFSVGIAVAASYRFWGLVVGQGERGGEEVIVLLKKVCKIRFSFFSPVCKDRNAEGYRAVGCSYDF